MIQTQFLLFFLAIIPLIGVIVVNLVRNYPAVLSKISFILPIIFLINVAALFQSYLDGNYDSIVLFSMSRDISIGFSVEPLSFIFLFLISVIWVSFTLYSNRYFSLNKDKRLFQFQVFSILSIEFITLIIFSKNLVSVFLFYQSLIFCLYFFNTYFMHKSDIKASYNFTFFLLLSSFAFLLAIILTYKLTGQVEFVKDGIINNNLSLINYIILLLLYLIGIVAIVFLPLYLLYGNLYYLSPPIIIIVFVVSYGLVSLFILLKIISQIFGAEIFISYNQQIRYDHFIIFILGANLLISAVFAVISSNLKKIFIYLFFNQLIFTILSFFFLGDKVDHSIIFVISFILNQILIFLCMSNISLYLTDSKEENLKGIFYRLKITIPILIFALFNVIGLAPGIGFVEKYFLFKKVISGSSLINLSIIIANISLNIICVLKIIYPMVASKKVTAGKKNEIAKKIELDLRLMLPIILIAFIIFSGFLFPSLVVDFPKKIF